MVGGIQNAIILAQQLFFGTAHVLYIMVIHRATFDLRELPVIRYDWKRTCFNNFLYALESERLGLTLRTGVRVDRHVSKDMLVDEELSDALNLDTCSMNQCMDVSTACRAFSALQGFIRLCKPE